MALYNNERDVSLFRHLNRELMQSIIEQQVGLYKVQLDKTVSNIYGESSEKSYMNPVKLYCLIYRNPQETSTDALGPDLKRAHQFAFLRDDLVDVTTVPENGDIVMWQENYYEIDAIVENQLVGGKSPDYTIEPWLNTFGSSWSILANAVWIRPDKLNFVKTRL